MSPDAKWPPVRGKIVRNRAQCSTCKDVIESKHRHDFVTCKCGTFFVDGGKAYLRRGYLKSEGEGYVEMSETSEQS